MEVVPELLFTHSQFVVGLQERRGFLPPPLTHVSVPCTGKGPQLLSPGLCCKARSVSTQEENQTLTDSYTWRKEREIPMYHLISFSPASVQTTETQNQRAAQGWGSKSQTRHELSLSGMLT